MKESLPLYIPLTFGLTTVATVWLFIWTIRNARSEQTRHKAPFILIGLVIWLTIQAVLPLNNLYNSDTHTFPPKIIWIGIFPASLTIVLLFATSQGRLFLDSLPLKNLTYLHIVRIPVEIVLYGLFLHQLVPELMTFEGRNFDILAGMSAPFVAYFGGTQKKLSRKTLVLWNLICLGLLAQIVVSALFSVPSPIQQWAWDQPNVAILYFPFSWLPTCIVPIVLLGHLTSLRQLLTHKTN